MSYALIFMLHATLSAIEAISLADACLLLMSFFHHIMAQENCLRGAPYAAMLPAARGALCCCFTRLPRCHVAKMRGVTPALMLMLCPTCLMPELCARAIYHHAAACALFVLLPACRHRCHARLATVRYAVSAQQRCWFLRFSAFALRAFFSPLLLTPMLSLSCQRMSIIGLSPVSSSRCCLLSP